MIKKFLTASQIRKCNKVEQLFLSCNNSFQESLDPQGAFLRVKALLDKGADFKKLPLGESERDILYYLYLAKSELPEAKTLFDDFINQYNKAVFNFILPLNSKYNDFNKIVKDRCFFQFYIVATLYIVHQQQNLEESELDEFFFFPSHVLYLIGLFEKKYKTRFSVDWIKEIKFDESYLKYLKNNFIAQVINNSDISDFSNYKLPILLDNILNSRDLNFKEHIEFGLPPSVAYKIALGYLNGKDLVLNKDKALSFLYYASICGENRSTMALHAFGGQLFFLDDEAIDPYVSLLELYTQAFHVKLIYDKFPFVRKILDVIPSNYNIDGIRCDFNDDLVYNFTTLLLYLKEHYYNNNEAEVLQNELFLIQNYIVKRLCENQYTPSFLAACINYITYIDDKYLDFFNFELSKNEIIQEPFDNLSEAYDFILSKCREHNSFYLAKTLSDRVFVEVNPKNKKYFELLSQHNDGKALFCLASKKWKIQDSRRRDVQGAELSALWKDSALSGYGIGWFNYGLSKILTDDFTEAAICGKNAVSCGISQGYYLMYKGLFAKDSALACTYLRYAKEYLFSKAQDEIISLKEKGLYKPLPFIEEIERLEAISDKSPEACLFLADIYMQDKIFPVNFVKHIEYLYKALSLGCEEAQFLILHEMKLFYPVGSDKNNLMSVYRSLENNQYFAKEGVKNPKNLEIVNLAYKEIYDCLKKGRTEFERRLFANFEFSHLGKSNDLDLDLSEFLKSKDKVSSADDNSLEFADFMFSDVCAYLNSDYLRDFFYDSDEKNLDFKFSDYINSKEFENYLKVLTIYNQNKSKLKDDPHVEFLKALLALRSRTLPIDYNSYRNSLSYASNANISWAKFLINLNFDGLFLEHNIRIVAEDNKTMEVLEGVLVFGVEQ